MKKLILPSYPVAKHIRVAIFLYVLTAFPFFGSRELLNFHLEKFRQLARMLVILLVVNITAGVSGFCQDDLLDMLEEDVQQEIGNEPVQAMFKTQRVVNAHSTETVKAKTLDFRISHRFGSIGMYKAEDLFGLDNADDIRFSFDYGITDNLHIGIGRSKRFKLIDGNAKYRLLTQTTNDKIPLSIVLFSQMGLTPQKDPDSLYQKGVHRFNYTHQVILGRKFGSKLSLELLPTIHHRNMVDRRHINAENPGERQNTLFALGAAGRFKITQRTAILLDYFYLFTGYGRNHPQYNPLGIGVEIETGGHVFHITATNSAGIIEGNYLTYTRESWTDMGIKLGFNISRVFSFDKH